MSKTLTAIVMTAALGLGALVGGCYKTETDSQAVTGQYTVKVPKHDGELINAGQTSAGTHYVAFKNKDGTITLYKELDDGWFRVDYQK